jgi:hypothetical protein
MDDPIQQILALLRGDLAPQKIVEEIDFRELPDGTLLETIADPNDPSKTALAIFQHGEISVNAKFELGDRIFLPRPYTLHGMRDIRFVSGTEPHEGAMELWKSIVCVLRDTLDLSGQSIALLGAYVLSTWLTDKFPIAPYLSLVGPPGSGKTTALRILSLLCRRGLATADISSAAFYDLSENVTKTLLIDEAATLANRRQFFHMMRAGSTPGLVTLRNNQSYRSFGGARAFAWKELPDDAALNSRCLIIPMKCCSRQNLQAPSDPEVLEAAARVQKQLLHFRLSNYATMRLHPIAGEEELQPRARVLLRCLAAPFQEESGINRFLLGAMQDQQILRDVLSPQQSATIAAIFEEIHQIGDGVCSTLFFHLQDSVNLRLMEQREAIIKSGKQMGSVLTSLGLTDRKPTNEGTALILSRAIREQVHALQRTHKVGTQTPQWQMDNCLFCRAKGGDSTTPSKDPSSPE